jgi:hypothetical protein
MARLPATSRAAQPKVDLGSFLRRQRGLVTRPQALAAGLDDEAIRREIRNARWQRVLPGFYACFTGELSLEQRRVAAVLYAGAGAQLTGVSALSWYGMRYLPADDGAIHVAIPHDERRTSRGFVRIWRTIRPDPHARFENGYWISSVARSVADACRKLNDLHAVRAIVAEAAQRSLTTVDALHRELDLAGTSYTSLFRRALGEIGDGAQSAPEAQLQEIFKGTPLEGFISWNPKLEGQDGTRLPSPDGWIDKTGIAIEADSREYHLSPEGWKQTMRRHNTLGAYGALMLHFTPTEIRSRRGQIRATVEQAHRQRFASGARASIRVIAE